MAQDGSHDHQDKRLVEEVAADTDDSNNVSKGKLKVDAPDARGADNRMRKQLPHSITERERRKRMNDMYTNLQSLLPHIPGKVDKATILGETVSFIKVLEGTVSQLEKWKHPLTLAQRVSAVADLQAASSSAVPAIMMQGSLDLPQGWAGMPKQQPTPTSVIPVGLRTWAGKNVVLSVSKDDAFINMCLPRCIGVLTQVLCILEKHHVNIITAQVSSDGSRTLLNIIAYVNSAAIRQLGGEPLAPEYIYKLAASEIIDLLSA